MGAQRVLHPAAELSQDLVGDVRGRLGDEDDAHALGADEPHRAHHGLQEGLRGAGEQQVRLVEEEHHGGLVRVADLRQGLEELGEQPHEEGGEQRALGLDVGQLQGGDDAAPIGGDPHEVTHVERRLTEEGLAAGRLQGGDLPQDDPGRGRGDPADGLELLLTGLRVRQVVDDGAQVLQIQQGQPLAVRPVEDQLEGGGLRVVQAQDPREQDRPELGDRRADRGAADAGAGVRPAEVEQLDGEGLALPVLTGGGDAGGDLVIGGSGLGQSGQVPLDVGQEHRDAGGGQPLGQELERAGLTGSGRPGHQRVPVEQSQRDAHRQVLDRRGLTARERVEVGAHRQGGGGEAVAGTHLGGVAGLLGLLTARGMLGRSGGLGLRRGRLLNWLLHRLLGLFGGRSRLGGGGGVGCLSSGLARCVSSAGLAGLLHGRGRGGGDGGVKGRLGGGCLGCGGFGGGLGGLGLEACDLSGIGHGAIVNAEPARALTRACQWSRRRF